MRYGREGSQKVCVNQVTMGRGSNSISLGNPRDGMEYVGQGWVFVHQLLSVIGWRLVLEYVNVNIPAPPAFHGLRESPWQRDVVQAAGRVDQGHEWQAKGHTGLVLATFTMGGWVGNLLRVTINRNVQCWENSFLLLLIFNEKGKLYQRFLDSYDKNCLITKICLIAKSGKMFPNAELFSKLLYSVY